jgi:class 3 adenylate cyclase
LNRSAASSGAEGLLAPYVSRLALSWPAGGQQFQLLEGSLAFIDISGFTHLSEILAARGKVGAEELTGLLDRVFAELIQLAYEASGELVKWGGDAILVFFAAPGHLERAVAATWRMQQRMEKIGRLKTSAGPFRLAMSVGVHSGLFHFFLVGSRHRELVLAGPGATATAAMEAAAQAGEILVSSATAGLLVAPALGPRKGPGYLVVGPPKEPPARPPAGPGPTGQPAGDFLPEAIREHLLAGPLEAEHRQVAVGFIDFSGTDALLGETGPSAVAAELGSLIGRAQDACARRGVSFWETDIAEGGGKVMLVAGAPSASDDDAGRLLGALRDVVGGGGRLGLRAGANYGRAFAGNFGPPYRRTYSVKGDAVNLAARLMAKAAPGEVLVSEAALWRSRARFEAEEVEPFLVKGKAAPVCAYRLGQPRARRAGRPKKGAGFPFLGRERELEVLVTGLGAAAGGKGSCAVLEGPPGIGKSRITEELMKSATGFRALSATCDEYRSTTPYAAFRDLGRQCLSVGSDASPQAVGRALTELVARRAPELAAWLPLVAGPLDAEVPATAESNALEERFRRLRLEEAFIGFLRAALAGPSIIAIDDAHYMDPASAELLERLLGQLPSLPWLVLLSRWQGPEGALPGQGEGITWVEVGPLPDSAVAQLLNVASEAEPLPPHRSVALSARSGGNPMFLLELVAHDRRLGPEGALPDTVEGAVAAQIDRLAPPQRRLLRAASVLGLQFSAATLAEMAGEADIGRRLQDLGEFLVENGPGTVQFRHGIVREAAYEGLAYSRRQELHARAGEILEKQAGEATAEVAALLALHFSHAGHHRAAWRYARLAAERAWALYATVEASTFFEQALAAGRALKDVPPSDLLAVAEALGEARARLGELARAKDAFRLACRWATAPEEHARLYYKVAQVAERAGHYQLALRMLSLAERALGRDDVGSAQLRAELRGHYGLVRNRQGRGEEAVRLLQEAWQLAESAGAAEVAADILLNLDYAELSIGRGGDGDRAHKALDYLRSLGTRPWLEGRALNLLGIRAYFAGRWSEAARYYAEARAAVERAGDLWGGAIYSGNIAEILSDQGHLAEAETLLLDALRTYRAVGTPSFIGYGTLLLGRLAARLGQAGRARSLLEEARRIFAADGEALGAVHAKALLAESLLLAGDLEGASSEAAEALAEAGKLAGRDTLAPLLLRVLGVAGAGRGEGAERARGYIEQSIEVARARGSAYELALSLQAMADLWPASVPEGLQDELGPLWEELGVIPPARSLCPRVRQ